MGFVKDLKKDFWRQDFFGKEASLRRLQWEKDGAEEDAKHYGEEIKKLKKKMKKK